MGKRILVGLFSLVLVVACGRKKHEEAPRPTELSDGYLLSSECSTGQHTFKSNNAADLKRQVCEALQDDNVNNECARDLRFDMFQKKCLGYTWQLKPKIKPVTPIPPPPVTPISADIRESLLNLLVNSYAIPEDDMSGEEARRMTTLAAAMKSCGLSYIGPKCVDSPTNSLEIATRTDPNGDFRFYSLFKTDARRARYAYRFVGHKSDSGVQAQKLEVLRLKKTSFSDPIWDHLEDVSNSQIIATFSITNDFFPKAIERLEKTRDLRELYHLSLDLLDSNEAKTNPEIRTRVIEAFRANKATIIESKDEEYQALAIEFLVHKLPEQKALAIEISKSLIHSDSERARQIAAVVLFGDLASQEDPAARNELRPLVLSALYNESFHVRQIAIETLGKMEDLDAGEQNLILTRINDSSSEVRDTAIKVAEKFNLDTNHFSTVRRLARSNSAEVRIEGAKLLSRIEIPAAIYELIANIKDKDEGVRRQIGLHLEQKSLDDRYVPLLAKLFEEPLWTVRVEAAKLLGKIPGVTASNAILAHLADTNEGVRTEILSQVSKRALTEASVATVAKAYTSPDKQVRRDTTKVLTKINAPASYAALWNQLGKEKDPEVRAELQSSVATFR